MEVAVRDPLYIGPGHDVFRHGERDFREEVRVELPLTVDRDDVGVLDLEDYSEHGACGRLKFVCSLMAVSNYLYDLLAIMCIKVYIRRT
jgi:hypothetical protein